MLTVDEKKILGSGSFGTVFSGLLDELPVAVKKINLSQIAPYLLKNISHEITIQRQLKHDNIVPLLCHEQKRQYLYIAMELLEELDLFDLLYEKPVELNASTCISISQDIVAGLDYLHNQGFLHRDIKPENILFNTRRQAKIADFSFVIKKSEQKQTHLVGTKIYIAPELALAVLNHSRHYLYSEGTDIYALGIMLLEMISRRNPYNYDNPELSWEDIAQGNYCKLPQNTNPLLAEVTTRCLAANPEQRDNASLVKQLFFKPSNTIQEESEIDFVAKKVKL
jgi:serine/threonine protein kinase